MDNNNGIYTQSVPLTEKEIRNFKSLCQKAIYILQWEITLQTYDKYVLNVPPTEGDTGEIVIIEIQDDAVIVTGQSVNNKEHSAEKNHDNVVAFLSAVDELKGRVDAGIYDEEKPEPGLNVWQTFLHFVTPTKDYFFTPILLILNVVVFIAMVIGGANFLSPDVEIMIKWGANFNPITLGGQPWRLLTACFLHHGVLHLLFNMYALLYVGVLLEPLIGKWRFITLYLLAGIGGCIASTYFNTMAVGAGASGAIFGLYGAFLALLTTNFIERETRIAFFTSMSVFVLYNLFIGFTKTNIDNSAHIGGLITGAIISYLYCIDFSYTRKTKEPRNLAGIVGALGIVALLAIAFMLIPRDFAMFEENRKQFSQLEETTMTAMQSWDDDDGETKMKKISDGIKNWEECAELMDAKQYHNLPELVEHNREILFNYSLLRRKQFEAFGMWATSGNEKDIERANKLTEDINKMLK